MVLQPARQVEEGGEAEDPEEAGGQRLGGARGGAGLGGQRGLHAGLPRHPGPRPHTRPSVQAAFQHRLQFDVSLHPAAKLHGGRLQVNAILKKDPRKKILRKCLIKIIWCRCLVCLIYKVYVMSKLFLYQVSIQQYELPELDVPLLPPDPGLCRHGLQLLLHVPPRLPVLALLLRPELRRGFAVRGLWPQLTHGLLRILTHLFILELRHWIIIRCVLRCLPRPFMLLLFRNSWPRHVDASPSAGPELGHRLQLLA